MNESWVTLNPFLTILDLLLCPICHDQLNCPCMALVNTRSMANFTSFSHQFRQELLYALSGIKNTIIVTTNYDTCMITRSIPSKSSIDETGNNLSTQRVEIALVSSATLAIPSYFKTAVF